MNKNYVFSKRQKKFVTRMENFCKDNKLPTSWLFDNETRSPIITKDFNNVYRKMNNIRFFKNTRHKKVIVTLLPQLKLQYKHHNDNIFIIANKTVIEEIVNTEQEVKDFLYGLDNYRLLNTKIYTISKTDYKNTLTDEIKKTI